MSTHLPTWSKKTLSSAGTNIRNPIDPRITRSNFQRACITLSCHDSLLSKIYYLMIGYHPNLYYHSHEISKMESCNGRRIQFSSKKCNFGARFPFTWEETDSMQVGISDKGCCIWHNLQIQTTTGWTRVLPGPRRGLSWDLCTSGKDGFHKTSFGHRLIQALGGASHICQEWFSSWRPTRGDIYEASQRLYIRSFLGVWVS